MPLHQLYATPPCRPAIPAALRGNIDVGPSGSASALDAGLAAALFFAADRRRVAAGTELVSEFETCSHLYVVVDGWMAMKRILEDGRQQILDFVLPGDVIGDATGQSQALKFSVEALTDAEVICVPASRVPELLQRIPSLAPALLQAMQRALSRAYDGLTDIGRRSAREAVSSFLLRMEERIRAAVGERPDGSVEFPLTQENIGDALGLTAVHVCRTLRALSKEGIVSACRKGLAVSDHDRLAEIAGLDMEFDAPAVAKRARAC